MYSLGIVQTHTNQFDGPLFRKIASAPDIELTVYLTRPDGHEVFYDPELGHASGWDFDIGSGYCFRLFPADSIGRLRMVHRIVSSRHDLIVVAGYSSISLLMIACLGKLCHTPVGLRADSVLLYRTATWKWRLKDHILPILYRLYTTMHPVGSLARSMMLHYGISPESMFLFPYAVDNDFLRQQYELAALERNALRKAMGIDSEDQVILGIMKFVPREDPLTLLAAYDQVSSSFPCAHLILVGNGYLRSEINGYIARRALRRVHLPGYVPYSHLPRYFAVADVFVHPARVEPWGVSVNEALVCGLPVIAADTVGAAYDLVEEGRTGFLFHASDVSSLTLQLKRILCDCNLRQFMGENATGLMTNWSYSLTLRELRKALEHVSSGKRRLVGGAND